MSDAADKYHEAKAAIDRSDRKQRAFEMVAVFIAAIVVIVGVLVLGDRQSEYHKQQTHTDARINCAVDSLESILSYLKSAGEAQAAHQPPPTTFVFPKPC